MVRRNKYGSVPTVVDNVRFHSKKEARRYGELKLLEKAGEIRALECQPRFALRVNNTFIGTYVADFRYVDRGVPESHVVEDAKGMRTQLYQWKKKHVEAQYGITIREV